MADQHSSRANSSRRNRLLTLAGLGVLLASTLIGITAEANAAGSFAGHYVALGDSYTAGPGIANQESGSGLCSRSDHNYPNLVAQAIQPAAFTDVSCSGAVTDDMTTSQFGAPPQFDALAADDALVTLGIGGNDAGFAQVVLTCVTLGVTDSAGSPCKDHYVSGGTDQLAATFAQVAPKIGAVLQGIHQRAPQARVLLVGYPDILPDSKAKCDPNNPNDAFLATGDVPWLDTEEQNFNRILADQADANNATFVDTFTSSVGHDSCQADGVRWIESLLDDQNGGPVHPNGLGMRNDTNQILAALGS